MTGCDSMTTDDLGGTGSGNQRFACGHGNPMSNRYCDVCGADAGRRCPLCSAPNRGQAKFCGACGARLPDQGSAHHSVATSPAASRAPDRVAPESARTAVPKERTDMLGWDTRVLDDPRSMDSQNPRRSGRSGVRDDDPFLATTDDVTVEDEWAARDRRRKVLLLVAAAAMAIVVAIAIVLRIEQASSTRQGGFLGRAESLAVAERGSAPASRGEQPPAVPAISSPARASEPVAADESPREATEAPAVARAAGPPTTSAALPSRPRSEPRATPAHEARGEGVLQPQVPTPETSEERVADFLIEQLGPAPAAEKALSMAAWYDAGQSEHAYWQRVGEAIRRRGGS